VREGYRTKDQATYQSEGEDHLKRRRTLCGIEAEGDRNRIEEVRDRQFLDELEEGGKERAFYPLDSSFSLRRRGCNG
jgi:hypothetical protein